MEQENGKTGRREDRDCPEGPIGACTYRFDAVTFRVGARTQATEDLSVYFMGNLRVPTESFTYRAEQFYVLPTAEAGGTFVW